MLTLHSGGQTMPVKRRSFLTFMAMSSPALADNPYAAAGISDPAHVTQFLARLKHAMAGGDRATVVAMVNYPPASLCTRRALQNLPQRHGPARRLRAGVHAGYRESRRQRQARRSVRPDQGVMIGQGEIWMNEIAGSMKIITVNHVR